MIRIISNCLEKLPFYKEKLQINNVMRFGHERFPTENRPIAGTDESHCHLDGRSCDKAPLRESQ